MKELAFSLFDADGTEVVSTSIGPITTQLLCDIGAAPIIENGIERELNVYDLAIDLRPIVVWGRKVPTRTSPLFHETIVWLASIVKACDDFPNARIGERTPT